MTNEPRNPKPNPYESLPTVPTFSLTSDDNARMASYIGAAPARDHGAHRHAIAAPALDVATLPVPNDGTPAYLAFVMRGHTLTRATLVATAETRGGPSWM